MNLKLLLIQNNIRNRLRNKTLQNLIYLGSEAEMQEL